MTESEGDYVKRGGFLAVVLLFSMISPVMAHHGTAGYDMSNMTTFAKATITEIEWTNPHCQIRFVLNSFADAALMRAGN